MKETRKIVLMLTTGAVLALAWCSAWAGASSGKQATSRVNHRADRVVMVFGAEGDWNNPDACTTSDRILLDPAQMSDKEYTEKYAMLLAAHMTGREINASLEGCALVGNDTFPLIKQISLY